MALNNRPLAQVPKEAISSSTGCDGFSLVDMLVALILLATIIGLTVPFYGQFRVLKRIEVNTANQMEVNALSAYLEETIGMALPLPLLQGENADQHFLLGTPTSILFVVLSRQGTRAIGLREMTLTLNDGPASATLIQETRPRRLEEADRNALAVSISLSDHIRLMEFEYMTYDPATLAPVWSETWMSPRMLPAAVRFRVQAEHNGTMVSATGYADLHLSRGPGLPATALR